jgi:hypothetical protein
VQKCDPCSCAATDVLTVLPHAASKSRNPTIQVHNVTHFAYGTYQNGDVDIWAAGEAGWYQIKPAESYIDLFQSMIEAVNILYFMSDCYKGGKFSADELFSKYSKIHHISAQQAKDKFYSHGPFLASRMMKGEEGIRWGLTGFYQHLRKMQPVSLSKYCVSRRERLNETIEKFWCSFCRTNPNRTTAGTEGERPLPCGLRRYASTSNPAYTSLRVWTGGCT